MRRLLIAATLLASATLATHAQTKATKASVPASKSFTVVDATIADMRTALEQGRVTSRQLVQQYLMRIGTYEERLHAAMTVNPDGLREPCVVTPKSWMMLPYTGMAASVAKVMTPDARRVPQ